MTEEIATFTDYLTMLRRNSDLFIALEHLIEPARAELKAEYMSSPKLRNILLERGYRVERRQIDSDDWIVSAGG